ncbi:MAG: CRISPR-associated protein Cas5 [Piscirickettsiaceae bacterium CG_4_10_14_3_um_filter_44_349]|uniref:CRISPR-associated protein Cas5 n=1 Tax=Shewanella sp. CG18_big_fil_WC_8_21_14_2_50_42_11 TaxID=1975538 RepID=UPI000C51A239|nr:CRISPR-associated protein Cas5 [Shewanella sp. CG18_big_fil_WC_8_21_14_2_50_42_11]NCQ47168.1 CRISPR-associated protein Cas5 [Shewanella frigidimarina]PIP98515.1 MAG: CRISPR-associated protein Cas5 [Shewanella sp. CG18_big_fil_WC_8_21_14_2_50_42_11]PIX79713.1 MAG: CRISPR-associated protein Cas5 [Piscirickettsiaceae bacterium CG_4_10_14_3_um_filter_44_349]
MSKYQISMEISGPFAMWSRPDTGATPTSYPIPTWSAVKGIFESVAFFADGKAWIRPTYVEICKPKGQQSRGVNFQKYTNNYRGPLREKSKSNFQFSSLILSEVCYRLHGVVENGSGEHLKHGNNPSHALQAIFERRLKKGQCQKTPSLGWNEFTPDYWGPVRNDEQTASIETEVDTSISMDLVSILDQVFDKAISGKYQPKFLTGEKAILKKGVFFYD